MSAATLARIEAVENCGAGPVRRGGVLMLPRILPLDQWEAQAISSQAALVSATREGVDDRPANPVQQPQGLTP